MLRLPTLPIRFRRWLPGVGLFLLAVVIYVPSMTNGFIWDDPQYVVDNPTLKSAAGLWQIWTDPGSTPQYYPLVHTTFWIEAQLWGTDHAGGFHMDNILLHALAAVLLWRALVGLQIRGGWLAAGVFAVHPVMVESVTWVTERKNVLSIVFYLLAFHAYLRSGKMNIGSEQTPALKYSEEPGQNRKNRKQKKNHAQPQPLLSPRRWYVASIVLFLFALLSKTVTCSLPTAILLIIWWKRGRIVWADVKPLIPMLILGLGLSAVTSHLERTHVGARGPDFNWSSIDRCLIAGHAICFYAGKIVWPHPLIFMYPHWDLHAGRGFQFVYPAVVVLIVTGLYFTRRWIGRGPVGAMLFFIGTLVPALGFVNVYPMRYSFVADHFQYLASLGLIVLIAGGLSRIPRFNLGINLVILVPLAWLTWQQQKIYADAKTLWRNTIAQNETCWMAHVNLASVLAKDDPAAALAQSLRALQLAPNEADTNYDVGVSYAKRLQWTAAADMFRRAVQCDSNCAAAWSYLARDLWDHGGTPQSQADAVSAAETALSIQTNLSDPYYVLAREAESRGNLPEAVIQYGKALAIDDENYTAHYNLGNCLLQTGHPGEAAGEYLKALAHDKNNAMAWTNLGYAYLAVGRTTDAERRFEQALAINPDLAPARAGLMRARSQRISE